ncbi:hypothetical protein LBMAG21_08730 [Armatimonadota bacterium]|nr:hypothetical protein LBMAG21_08730 [Armatimonadota bacterium]
MDGEGLGDIQTDRTSPFNPIHKLSGTESSCPNIAKDNLVVIEKVFGTIQRLTLLEPDWDGEDAPAISPKCLKQAQEIVHGITKYLNKQTLPYPFPIPSVGPTNAEGVFLRWYLMEALFLVIIEPNEIMLQKKQRAKCADVFCLPLEHSIAYLAQSFSELGER